jgi:hypothetical protein
MRNSSSVAKTNHTRNPSRVSFRPDPPSPPKVTPIPSMMSRLASYTQEILNKNKENAEKNV